MYLAGNSVMSTVRVRSANNSAAPSSTVSAQLSIDSQCSQETDTFIAALEELCREAKVNWRLPIGKELRSVILKQDQNFKKPSNVIMYFVLLFSRVNFLLLQTLAFSSLPTSPGSSRPIYFGQ